MRHNQAINSVQCSGYNGESLKTFSAVQTAETLEEINQKTPTLRDYFAAMAMQALIAADKEAYQTDVAKYAYSQADKMLEARK